MNGRLFVLVTEDDTRLGTLLTRVLADDGHRVARTATLAEARETIAKHRFDVWILDRMLPDGDGLGACEALRQENDPIPVLVLTARGELTDRVDGLRSGADDYLVKPFDVEELLARVRALARRGRAGRVQSVGSLELDRLCREVRVDGRKVDLTPMEFDLLACLAETPDEVVSRAVLLQRVWDLAVDPGSGVLDVRINSLRVALGSAARVVQTVRGVGYKLVP